VSFKILVSDTSILIELERGGLLEEAFNLPMEFAVPDVLYVRELSQMENFDFIENGILIEELNPESVENAQQYRTENPGLSIPDCFSLALAKDNGWPLLTGDGLLRRCANKHKVECHGIFWVLDLMNEKGVATAQQLHTGLQKISEHPRCRLTKRLVNEALQKLTGLS